MFTNFLSQIFLYSTDYGYYSNYGTGYYGFDPTIILVLIGSAICAIASSNVSSTYKKYSTVSSKIGLTATQVARRILDGANLQSVPIGRVSGDLTDHYVPSSNQLNLSDTTSNSTSIAAIGVAAHECGHAIQDKENYKPLTTTMKLVPVVNFGSSLALPLIMVGLVIGWMGLQKIGVALFSLSLIYYLINLKVEFDASDRALAILKNDNILDAEELAGVKKVLRAAAYTYVAGTLSTFLTLLRFLLIIKRNNRNN